MNKQDRTRINHLISLMLKADHYYELGHPVISDGSYDNMYAELKALRQRYPHNKKILSYFSDMHATANTFPKRKQLYHVRSLDKTRTVPAVSRFLNRWNTNPKSLWYTPSFLVEKKNDGISSVFYMNDNRMGKPLVVLTRGSGVAGADITPEAKYYARMDIHKIMKRLNGRHLVVRGELLIGHQSFHELNQQKGIHFENCRNLASGSVFDKDPKVAGKRGVFLSAYTILDKDDWNNQYPTELQQMKFLRSLGFNVIQDIHMFPNTSLGKKQTLHYMFDYSHRMRLGIDHDIDGLVLKPNYTANENKLGWNLHGPRFSVSFKFLPQQALTRVKKIRYQVSASGRLTPVIVFTHPVRIFGANISKCTGSSLGNMKKHQIMINGYITVKRMNDVIPKAFAVPELNKSVKNLISPYDALPDDAVKKGKFYYIPKSDMSDSLPVMVNRWSKLVSKPCLNIMGLSDKMLTTMIKDKIIDPHEFGSLWYMNKQRFLKMPGFGEKGWDNLQNQLRKAENCPLSRVLLGLPIDNAGSTIFNPVSKRIGDMQIILNNPDKRKAMEQKLLKEIPQIKGLGSATIPVIKQLFSRDIITQLQSLSPYLRLKDNQPKSVKKPASEQKLAGLHLCITGKLSKSRKVFTNLIKANGGKVQGTVNGKTDYLLCNHASSSSKYKKATKLGTKIINESQLRQLIDL